MLGFQVHPTIELPGTIKNTKIKKNGLDPEMSSGVRLCMGKVLGTP